MRDPRRRRLRRAVAALAVAAARARVGEQRSAAHAAYAQIEGSGLDLEPSAIVHQWIADVDANGMQVVYTGGGSSQGRKDFARTAPTSASPRSPTRASTSTGNADNSNGRAVRLPADRRRRHRVHLPAQGRRRAGPQPAAVRRDDREDLHRPDHQLERPGDHRGQQRPGAPVVPIIPVVRSDGVGHHRAVHDLDGQRSTPTSGGRYCGQAGLTSYYPQAGARGCIGASPAPTR